MKHYLLVYGCTLLIMVILDMLWLGVVAKEFYRSRLGEMLEFRMVPGIIFYLLYAVGIVVFVNGNIESSNMWQMLFLYGALFGLFTYSTYDLTNLATLKFWTLDLALTDIAWGMAVTGISASTGALLARTIERIL